MERRFDAVVFDWGGVISGSYVAKMADYEAALGLPAGTMPQLMGFEPHATDPENVWHRRELGAASAEEHSQWMSDRLSEVLGQQITLGVAMEREGYSSIGIHWAVIHRARELKADGLKLAVCTNNFREARELWVSTLPEGLFDVLIDSSEIGHRKPDPQIYLETAARLGVEPARCVFLDDFDSNVAGAEAVGMTGVHVGPDVRVALDELDALLGRGPA